jgi:two-component system response regulator AlgR
MDQITTIRTLIVDDEPPARARLKRLLGQVGECELVGVAGSGAQALKLIPALRPDLLLLDISMPGIDGMALAGTLQSMDQAPAVVFCTAWPDRALTAFDRDAVDYLVKPVRLERLQAAVRKVSRYLARAGQAHAETHFLRATVGGRTTRVALQDVLCLVAEDKYTTVWYVQGKTVLNESLVELEGRYPEQWLRIHRNALVARQRIRGLEKSAGGTAVLVLDGTDLRPVVSRRQLAAVRRFIRESD